MAALSQAGFDETNPNHKLIVCGDVFDRGPESYEIYLWLGRLLANQKVILIRGNHEDLLLRIYQERNIFDNDFSNGTTKTIVDLVNRHFQTSFTESDLKAPLVLNLVLNKLAECGVIAFLQNSFVDYYELDNYIFVHGFLPLKVETKKVIIHPKWRSLKEEWVEARWFNAQELVLCDGINLEKKTIVAGHIPTAYGHWYIKNGQALRRKPKTSELINFPDNSLLVTDSLIALDGFTAVSNQVNVLIIDR